MKEEFKELYRIDPLKVRRKIYESYPSGSKQRESIIKEEKIKELSYLNSVAHGIPGQFADITVEELKKVTNKTFIRFAVSLLLSATFFFSPVIFSLSVFEVFCSSIFGILSLFYSLKCLFTLYSNYSLIKEYSDTILELENKMNKLKKDIFDDPLR